MKKNGFAPLIIILVIAALGVVGYFGYKNLSTRPSITQTTIDVTNWKTYTNTKYHYSIEYPNQLHPAWGKEAMWGNETEEEKNPITTNMLWLIESGTNEPTLQVSVEATAKSLKEEEKIANGYNNGLVFAPQTLNNISALYASRNGNQYYILISNGFKYEIFASAKNVFLANKILSTFKFTK